MAHGPTGGAKHQTTRGSSDWGGHGSLDTRMATGLPGPEEGPSLFPRRRRGDGGGQHLTGILRLAAYFRALPSHDGRPHGRPRRSTTLLSISTELGKLLQGPGGEERPELNMPEKVERNMVKNFAISYLGLLTGSELSSLLGNLVTAEKRRRRRRRSRKGRARRNEKRRYDNVMF